MRGYDAGQKILGRKRHLLVDTLGLILHVVVHSAAIQDREGAKLVLPILQQRFGWLRCKVNTYHSNPHIRDTDGDEFDDGLEVATGFSRTSAISTPDTFSTILTAVEFRFGGANGISYRIEASTDFTNWSTIETNIIGTGGVITRFYSIESQPRRFFRSRRN